MVCIKQLDSYGQTWGAFDDEERLILLVERDRILRECTVRKYAPHHPKGRGGLLVTIPGTKALSTACKWVEAYLDQMGVTSSKFPPAKASSTQTRLRAKGGKTVTRP